MTTNDRMTEQLKDLAAIDAEEHTTEEWTTLIEAMNSGEIVIVSDSVGWYFLEALPPRWMPSAAIFAFCEGDDRYTVFVGVGSIWLMRTLPYGERAPDVLDARAREMRASYDRHRAAAQALQAAAA